MELKIGDKVKLLDNSGADSGKKGRIIDPKEVKLSSKGVPLIPGYTKPVDWSKEYAIKQDTGETITMLKDKVAKAGMDKATKLIVKTLAELVTAKSTEARELELYIDNDSKIYEQYKLPIFKNLTKKKQNGTYNSKLAPKAFEGMVEYAAKKYAKEFANPKEWNIIFDPTCRKQLAEEYVKEFESAFKDQEYDFMTTKTEATLKKALKKVLAEDAPEGSKQVDLWGQEDKDAIVNDLLQEFVRTTMDNEEITELRNEIADSLDFDSGRYSDWGKSGKFTADGDEYNLISSVDEAERIALKIVRQNLEEEPEIFNSDFIKHHLYISETDKRLISNDEADSRIEGMDDDEVLEKAGMKDEYDEAVAADDDELQEKILDKAKEEVQSTLSDEIEKELEDPIQYFVKEQGIYTEEEILKQNFISIDYDKAAKEAVNIDGFAHFISHYDGNYEETGKGLVYFKE